MVSKLSLWQRYDLRRAYREGASLRALSIKYKIRACQVWVTANEMITR
jgi:hypothetical protein